MRESETSGGRGGFTLEDFLGAIEELRRSGTMQSLRKIPGFGQMSAMPDETAVAEQEIIRIRAMIQAMTVDERRNPDKITASRRDRIAHGSGTADQEIIDLLRQFAELQRMMKSLSDRNWTFGAN
jgi:signal recognition particle subunit SRP54